MGKFCSDCGKPVNGNFCIECGAANISAQAKAPMKKLLTMSTKKRFFTLLLLLSVIILVTVVIVQSFKIGELEKEQETSVAEVQRLREYVPKARFLDRLTFVTKAGEKYHNYDCQYVKNASLYDLSIYSNVGQAVRAGYEACSICH